MSTDIIGLGTPSHIGVVVKDLNKTAEYYTSMWGLGPWQEVEISPTKEELLAGEPFKFKVASAQWGPVGLELLQPIEGKSILSEFLETNGEGIHHICFSAPNWDEVVSQMKGRGAKMVTGSCYKGIHWCYFETNPGGLIIEIIEEKS